MKYPKSTFQRPVPIVAVLLLACTADLGADPCYLPTVGVKFEFFDWTNPRFEPLTKVFTENALRNAIGACVPQIVDRLREHKKTRYWHFEEDSEDADDRLVFNILPITAVQEGTGKVTSGRFTIQAELLHRSFGGWECTDDGTSGCAKTIEWLPVKQPDSWPGEKDDLPEHLCGAIREGFFELWAKFFGAKLKATVPLGRGADWTHNLVPDQASSETLGLPLPSWHFEHLKGSKFRIACYPPDRTPGDDQFPEHYHLSEARKKSLGVQQYPAVPCCGSGESASGAECGAKNAAVYAENRANPCCEDSRWLEVTRIGVEPRLKTQMKPRPEAELRPDLFFLLEFSPASALRTVPSLRAVP